MLNDVLSHKIELMEDLERSRTETESALHQVCKYTKKGIRYSCYRLLEVLRTERKRRRNFAIGSHRRAHYFASRSCRCKVSSMPLVPTFLFSTDLIPLDPS